MPCTQRERPGGYLASPASGGATSAAELREKSWGTGLRFSQPLSSPVKSTRAGGGILVGFADAWTEIEGLGATRLKEA